MNRAVESSPIWGDRARASLLLLLAGLLFACGPATGKAGRDPSGGGGETLGAPAGAQASGATGSTQPAGPTAEPRELSLGRGELVVTYPPELELASRGEALPVASTIPACAEPFDHCLYLPAEAYAGTNLSAAGLRIAQRADLTAEVSCLLAQPNGWGELQPGVLRLPAAATSRFGGLGEGAAGSYSVGEVRRLWTGESCYEFESRLVLTRYENYEPGAVEEFTESEQAALQRELLGVTETATMEAGVTVEWPLAERSSLRAFVRLDSPGLEESPSSPLLISGSAVGPWFFEGSFPVELVSADGRVLASHYVMADGDWMTTGFVPFSGELEFDVAEPTEAVLILRRDNPSGLAEHDAAVRVPLTLLPD